MNPAAVTFAVVLPGLLVAHNVADHWLQTDHQAACKGMPGWFGRLACARHVATYTTVTAGTVAMLWGTLGLHISVLGFVAGQLISAASHYWADRRFTLKRLCDATGKGQFYRLGQPRSEAVAYTALGQERVQLLPDGFSGEEGGWDNPTLGTGAYVLDQSWHIGWLGISAVLTAVL